MTSPRIIANRQLAAYNARDLAAFMALFAAVIGERISGRLGLVLLGPLMAVGLGSVFYWALTEARGQGDLRPYYFVLLAGALLRAGDLKRAQASLDESTRLADATGQHAYIAEHAPDVVLRKTRPGSAPLRPTTAALG